MTHNMFSTPMTLALFILITASLFVYARGMFFHLGGDQNFFTRSKGGTKIFGRRQRGGPKFFGVGKGGDQKKLATGHHRQTAPPPGKK